MTCDQLARLEREAGLVAANDNYPTWDRQNHLPEEHKLYTSPKTLKSQRDLASVSNKYSSRGKPCTWPTKPGDWLTSKSCRVTKKPKKETADWDVWIGARMAPGGAGKMARVVSLSNDSPRPGHLSEAEASTGSYDDALPGTRIMRDLVGTDIGAVLDLVSELLRPANLLAANDNAPRDSEEQAANSGWGFETKLMASGIRPSVPALLDAYADGRRPRVILKSNGALVRFAGDIRYDSQKSKHGVTEKEFIEIGGRDSAGEFHGLQFFEGELLAYGQNGKRRRPWVDATTRSNVLPIDKSEDDYDAEEFVEEQSVSAGYLALGGQTAAAPYLYGQLAGITEAKGVGYGKTSAPAHEALGEIDRSIDAVDFIARADSDAISILTAIYDDETYAKIAIDRDFARSSASKTGKKLVLKALSEIKMAIAA